MSTRSNTPAWVKIVGFELAVLALIVLGIVGLVRGASGSDGPDAMAAAPAVTVELSTVTPSVAADYQYAADHRADFGQIPCYCGCDDSLGHRNLADCYVTPRARGMPMLLVARCAAAIPPPLASSSPLRRSSEPSDRLCAGRAGPLDLQVETKVYREMR